MQIYTCGGIEGTSTTNQCARYTIATNKWDLLAAKLMDGRNHAAHCKFNNSLVVLGGRSGGNTVGSAYNTGQQLSLTQETMSTFATLPEPRAGGGVCAAANSALWLFGGEYKADDCAKYGKLAGANLGCALAGGLMYSAAQGWRKLPDMPDGRHGVYPVVGNGRVYVIGGGVKSARSSSATVFHASLADLAACSSAR